MIKFTSEQKRERIQQLHQMESDVSAKVTNLDKEILMMLKKKAKFCKQLSHNRKYRNRLIEELYVEAPEYLKNIISN